jgi:hypothetical protein
MREAYTPYTKLVTLTGTGATEVTLHDSSGVAVECNYVQVAAVSGSADGYFFVAPDITSAKGYADQPTAAAIANNSASGVVGVVSNRETGVAVLSLAPSDKTSKIKVSQSDDTSAVYAITYGNVRLTNNLADSKLSRGN